MENKATNINNRNINIIRLNEILVFFSIQLINLRLESAISKLQANGTRNDLPITSISTIKVASIRRAVSLRRGL
jgi:hypothetical protein